MRTRIKVCGITRADDAERAVELGVDALGFVFWPGSPRCVSLRQAARIAGRPSAVCCDRRACSSISPSTRSERLRRASG